MSGSDSDFARYLREDLWDDVVRDSADRLANPLEFAVEALEDLFSEESDKEAGFRRFQEKLESFIWWADDAVQCLERVLADPPPDLGRIVRERAGVVVWVEDGGSERVGDDAAHERWLRETTARLRAMFDEYVARKTAESGPGPAQK